MELMLSVQSREAFGPDVPPCAKEHFDSEQRRPPAKFMASAVPTTAQVTFTPSGH